MCSQTRMTAAAAAAAVSLFLLLSDSLAMPVCFSTKRLICPANVAAVPCWLFLAFALACRSTFFAFVHYPPLGVTGSGEKRKGRGEYICGQPHHPRDGPNEETPGIPTQTPFGAAVLDCLGTHLSHASAKVYASCCTVRKCVCACFWAARKGVALG